MVSVCADTQSCSVLGWEVQNAGGSPKFLVYPKWGLRFGRILRACIAVPVAPVLCWNTVSARKSCCARRISNSFQFQYTPIQLRSD